MSLYDYRASQVIDGQQFPFYALIMAAMQQADTENQTALARAFPEAWLELRARYEAPGGILEGEPAQ